MGVFDHLLRYKCIQVHSNGILHNSNINNISGPSQYNKRVMLACPKQIKPLNGDKI